MKKLVIFFAGFLLVTATAMAQTTEGELKKDIKVLKKEGPAGKAMKKEDRKALRKLEGTEVAYQSKQKFYSDFGNIPVTKWLRSANFDEATFNKDGKVTTAYYDYESNLVGTISPVEFKDLPEAVQKAVNKEYKDYTIGKVMFYDDNEYNDNDILIYLGEFDGPDSYFIELSNSTKHIVVRSNMEGELFYFKDLD